MSVRYVVRHGQKIAVKTLVPSTTAATSERWFIKLTLGQVRRLHRASRLGTTTKVFHLLLFRSFQSYNRSFALPADTRFG